MNTEIDPFPVSELSSRYKIGKQALYNRLEGLEIKPIKQGNKSYISCEELGLLDRLHVHLINGGTMANFSQTTAITPVDKSNADKPDLYHQTPPFDLFNAFNAIASSSAQNAIASLLQSHEPLAHLKNLELAVNSEWLLSDSEVKQLIGVKPYVTKECPVFIRGSFIFSPCGKIGSQTAWRVTKKISS